MMRQISSASVIAAITIFALVASNQAQDYDGDAETAITGLGGLGGITGLSGLANSVVTGYAPIGAGSEMGEGVGAERGLSGEGSDNESGDYDDDSNDSAASEEHPILSKFFNLISGVRHKRDVTQAEAPLSESQVHTRVKRGSKGWVPYVSTYVKTDKKAHFKWGVSINFVIL